MTLKCDLVAKLTDRNTWIKCNEIRLKGSDMEQTRNSRVISL